MNYDELLQRSRALPYRMPTEANQLAALADRRGEVEEHAAGVRPILHGKVAALLDELRSLWREQGSPIERALYARLDRVGLVSRLLSRRPLVFVNGSDSYTLRDGTEGDGGFEHIGTAEERPPLTLRALQSYEEMPVSALLGVSVPTHFINAGGRYNQAIPGAPGSFEPRGILVGLVGARFERRGCMEWRHMRITREQNTPQNGYGADADAGLPVTRLLRTWARFYGLACFPTHEEAAADTSGRFLTLRDGSLLDAVVYKERIRMSVEAFLLEANDRARAHGKRAYVHAVGLGLGVWRVDPRQTDLMVEVYADILRSRRLPHVADIDFSWFGDARACGGVASGDVFTANDNAVRIHFSRRDPAAPLAGPDAGKLLVAMYAWDSNAFPGNEYWGGALSASGDPAAACCSNIAELQNPDVNPRVSGEHAVVFAAGSDVPTPLTAS